MPLDTDKFTSKIKQICLNMDQQVGMLDPDLLKSFKKEVNGTIDDIDNNKRIGRKLSIGIMGAMKAGKSSFLNALFFNGHEILPKAATPMTAALTVLSYAEQPSVTIHFFSEEDWQMVKESCENFEKKVDLQYQEELKKAQEPQTQSMRGLGAHAGQQSAQPRSREQIRQSLFLSADDTTKSYFELRDQASKHPDITSYLGQTQTIAITSRDLFQSLNDYVGAQGKFTPIVSYIEIQLNNDLLKDLEIVDTPGLNDPFTSRSQRTTDYLGKCDVVLYVSNVSQFITAPDIEFITKNMGENATGNAFIIGSQVDSGVLQYGRGREKDFRKAYTGTIKNMQEQAKKVLQPLCVSNASPNPKLIEAIYKNQQAYGNELYISSMWHGIGLKLQKGEPLTEGEIFVQNRLQQQFGNFDQFCGKPDDYLDFAKINRIKDKLLANISKDKEQIFAERNSEYVAQSNTRLLNLLSEMGTSTDEKIAELQSDPESLQKRQQDIERLVDAIKGDVEKAILEHSYKLQKLTNQTKIDMGTVRGRCTDIVVHSDTSTSSHTSTSGWWIFKSTHTSYTTTTTYTANVTDVSKNVRKFYTECLKIINDRMERFNNKEALLETLKRCVARTVDASDSNFNPNAVLNPIYRGLLEFEVGDIDFDEIKRVESQIAKDFPCSTVTGNDGIGGLYRKQTAYLDQIQESMSNKLNKRLTDVSQKLNKQAVTLCDSILDKAKKDHDKVLELRKDREANLAKLKKVRDVLNQAKNDLVSD